MYFRLLPCCYFSYALDVVWPQCVRVLSNVIWSVWSTIRIIRKLEVRTFETRFLCLTISGNGVKVSLKCTTKCLGNVSMAVSFCFAVTTVSYYSCSWRLVIHENYFERRYTAWNVKETFSTCWEYYVSSSEKSPILNIDFTFVLFLLTVVLYITITHVIRCL
jgi:hypothetical protein